MKTTCKISIPNCKTYNQHSRAMSKNSKKFKIIFGEKIERKCKTTMLLAMHFKSCKNFNISIHIVKIYPVVSWMLADIHCLKCLPLNLS